MKRTYLGNTEMKISPSFAPGERILILHHKLTVLIPEANVKKQC
jgi:hypothetical protein